MHVTCTKENRSHWKKVALLATGLLVVLCLLLLDARRRLNANHDLSGANASGVVSLHTLPLDARAQLAGRQRRRDAGSNQNTYQPGSRDAFAIQIATAPIAGKFNALVMEAAAKDRPAAPLSFIAEVRASSSPILMSLFAATFAGLAMLALAVSASLNGVALKGAATQSRRNAATPIRSTSRAAKVAAVRPPRLPRAADDRRGTRHEPSRRILVADDSFVNREILSETLRRLGAEVVCVDNGEDAVAAATSKAFDMILMDGCMPVMDGFTATRRIRAWERAGSRPSTPIVAVTAYLIEAGEDSWRDVGMNDCIIRPFSLGSMRICLEKHLPRNDVAGAATERETTVAGADAASPGRAIETAERWHDIALIDEDVLSDIRAVEQPGDDLALRMVKLYQIHAPMALAALGSITAADADQRAALAKAAHALRSLSLSIGAGRMAKLSEAIESHALGHRPRDGDGHRLSDLLAELENTIEPTVAALIAACARIPVTRPPQSRAI